MTLPSSGPISFNAINVELGQAGTTTASLGQASYRALAGVASGAISLSNFYGKSFASYKGYSLQSFAVNSWYLSAYTPYTSGITNASSNTFISIATNNGSSSSTARGGYAVIDKSTSSYLSCVGFSPLSGQGNVTACDNVTFDDQGNVWAQLSQYSSTVNSVLVKFSPTDNYTTIQKQYNVGFSTWTGNASNTLRPISTSYTFMGCARYYLYRVDSSGNIAYFNTTPTTGQTASEFAIPVVGATSYNQILVTNNCGSSSSSWGANYLFNIFDSSGTLTSQSILNNWDGASLSKFAGSLVVGPITNILSVTGTTRWGGGATTNKDYLAWFSMGSSNSVPTLLRGTRQNARYDAMTNPQSPNMLVAVDASANYEYWASVFSSQTNFPGSTTQYIFKVNSSGLIVQGWQMPFPCFTSLSHADNNGGVNVNGTVSGAFKYCGRTTISRILNNQISGLSFTNYPDKNGQYIYNIDRFSVVYNIGMSSASYPLTRAGTQTLAGPTVSSGQTMYTINVNDALGSTILTG